MRNIGNKLSPFAVDPLLFGDIMQDTYDPDEVTKSYTIKRDFTDKPLWVEVDTDKIIQVVDNIMNNAIKYSPAPQGSKWHVKTTHLSVYSSSHRSPSSYSSYGSEI